MADIFAKGSFRPVIPNHLLPEAALEALDIECAGALTGEYRKILPHEGPVVLAVEVNRAEIKCQCGQRLIGFDRTEEQSFQQITEHDGHDLEAIIYSDRVTIECLTCDQVVVVALAD